MQHTAGQEGRLCNRAGRDIGKLWSGGMRHKGQAERQDMSWSGERLGLVCVVMQTNKIVKG